MTQREKTLTPSDLDPIVAMHADLRNTIEKGLRDLQVEMRELNLTQAGLAKDIEHIKESQDKNEKELNVIRSTQLGCPASTGYVGTMKRMSRLEKFKDQALDAGVLKSNLATPQQPLPAVQVPQSSITSVNTMLSNPKILDRVFRASVILLLGAAVGGALLALAFFVGGN
jgi:hypothetical protein